MLENIFLMNLISENNSNEINSNNFSDAYLAYPDEDVLFDSNDIVRQIIISQKNIIEKINATLLNMHAGITPKYRGVHGGYWALVNQDIEHCGVTVYLVDPGIDTGGIISQKQIIITKKDNYATYPLLQLIKGLECIEEAITQIENGKLIIQKNGLDSKLYYHPTVIEYFYNRIFNNIK